MIALEASTLIAGDRNEAHGEIEASFKAAACLWQAWLSVRRDHTAPLCASDVAHMMSLLKKVRSQHGEQNDDDHVDDCGYAAIAGQLEGAGL
jgi:hypothetical protein